MTEAMALLGLSMALANPTHGAVIQIPNVDHWVGFSVNRLSGNGTTLAGRSNNLNSADRRAMYWNAQMGLQPVPGPAALGPSTAIAVSEDGSTLIGTYELAGTRRAYRYRLDGTFDDLGSLPQGHLNNQPINRDHGG